METPPAMKLSALALLPVQRAGTLAKISCR
jgi:hypothetical protein